ncbi:MAG: hypothetical protein FJ403_23335 [Verrucomicrobia bacterium]|nr:hypothetical protein [Verrucomicrobiota bacterium]
MKNQTEFSNEATCLQLANGDFESAKQIAIEAIAAGYEHERESGSWLRDKQNLSWGDLQQLVYDKPRALWFHGLELAARAAQPQR